MSNLSHWSHQQTNPSLRQILNLQTNNLGRLGKYRSNDTIEALFDLIKSYDETAAVTIVKNTCLYVDIFIATKSNEIYRLSVQRPTISDCKTLNEWMDRLCNEPVYINKVNNQMIWI